MSEARYYTPKIEEFHVGFEYEELWENLPPFGASEYTAKSEWRKTVFEDSTDYSLFRIKQILNNNHHSFLLDGEFVRKNKIRVKFLDTDDIRAELWTPYTKGNKRHFVLGEFHLYFYPNKEEPENSLVMICDATGVNVNIAENAHKLFHGTIKNRLKLREAMEMTRIKKR